MKSFATDLLMDITLVLTAQLCFGSVRLRNTLYTLAAMQLFTAAYFLFGSIVNHPALVAIQVLLLAYVLSGSGGARSILASTVYFTSASLCAAGAMNISCIQHPAAGSVSILLLMILTRRRRHILYQWNIEVYLESCAKSVHFRALIDTGNRLHEPISNLPVLIVEKSALPDDFYNGKPIRKLAFGVLGSSGEIGVFRPDKVCLIRHDGTLRKAPECYVAIYPGKIPGRTQALAPPEFTSVLKPLSSSRHTLFY